MVQSRRNFLETIVAAGMAAGVPILGEANKGHQGGRAGMISAGSGTDAAASHTTSSPHLIDHLAHNVNMYVPRTRDYKWGWNILIQQLKPCDDKAAYIVTAQNEPREPISSRYDFYDGGKDPRRFLTTTMTLGERPEVSWTVNPTLTHFVDNMNDDNYMELILAQKVNPISRIKSLNNLRPGHSQARHHITYDKALDVLLDLDMLVRAERDFGSEYHEFFEQDQWQLHRSLEGKSDPHSVTTIRPIGTGHNGTGVYDTQVYRVEGDLKRERMLAGRLHIVDPLDPRSSNGQLERDDSRSINGGPLSEIALIFLADGNVLDNRYKIANVSQDWARKSTPHMPHIKTWTAPYWTRFSGASQY